MIRSIIIDDEQAAINALSKKLEIHCEGVNVVAKCNTSKEGLIAITTHKPDLLFLDIEMPWMNGFELLSCLGDQLDFNVVFVTAYDKYAIQAFKVKAIDYLLKPVDKDDLINCVNRVKSHLQNFNKNTLLDLIGEMNKPTDVSKIMIHTTEGMEVLPLNEIIYCQAASNYTYIFTQDKRKIVVSKTLSDIESSLGSKLFIRTHKSYNVNLNCVQKYSNIEGGELVLKNGVKVPVSRRKKSEVLEAINNFI